MKRYSIIHRLDECYLCKTTNDLHKHEVFYGTANRKKSIEHGMVITLCARHHNMSNQGIHFNKESNLKVKAMAQRVFMEKNNKTEEEFRAIFGKSYII